MRKPWTLADREADGSLPLFRENARLGLETAFRKFHRENPHVLAALVAAATELRDAGVERIGIELLVARLRWIEAIRTRGDSFRLNDHTTAFYARVIMHRHPHLAGLFALRKRREPGTPFDPSTVVP